MCASHKAVSRLAGGSGDVVLSGMLLSALSELALLDRCYIGPDNPQEELPTRTRPLRQAAWGGPLLCAYCANVPERCECSEEEADARRRRRRP